MQLGVSSRLVISSPVSIFFCPIRFQENLGLALAKKSGPYKARELFHLMAITQGRSLKLVLLGFLTKYNPQKKSIQKPRHRPLMKNENHIRKRIA